MTPTGTPAETADLSIYARRESEARSYCRAFPTSFVSARNARMTDETGRDYIDFLAGCSSLNYGHNDPDMKQALIEHLASDGIGHALDFHTAPKQAFLETFERLILQPRDMPHKVMMTGPTGTNAVEAAMKLARKVTGRETVVAFTNGFHGMTLGALAATGNTGKRNGAGMPLSGVARLPYEGAFGDAADTLAQIETMLANPSSGLDLPAAFLLEPVQGEGGLNAASADWLRGLDRLAKRHGILLILDDIQAGCGRTGTFFSFEGMGVDPDMIPLAKSLSGYGLPFAALLLKPELDIWKPAEHNGTFRGNTHAFVTARVALEKFWSDDTFANRIRETSETLSHRLAAIAGMVPDARVKGRGMMQGVDVGSGDLAAAICADCFDRGLIIETSGAHDEVVKVLCPLTIEPETLTQGLDILAAAVAAQVAPAARAAAE